MKNSRIFGVLAIVAGLLCAGAFELDAQTVYSREEHPTTEPAAVLYRDGSEIYLKGENRPLGSAELRRIVGEEIFRETVEPATTQYNIGKKLMISGGVVMGVGYTTMIAALIYDVYNAPYYSVDPDYGYDYTYDVTAAEVIAVGGAIVGTVGFALLTAGTPLFCVGKGRLDWAVDDYNQWAATQRQSDYSLNFGAQKHGIGFALNF